MTKTGLICILICSFGWSERAFARQTDIFDGRSFGGPACSVTLVPDAATPGLRPLRLRIVSESGGDLTFAMTALDSMNDVDLVAGDLRVALEPYRASAASGLAAHPVWSALRSVRRFHLTEIGEDGQVRTARFDDFDLDALLARMASECDIPGLAAAAASGATLLVSPEATQMTFDPALLRLIKWAALRTAGEDRRLSTLSPEIDGAGSRMIRRALELRGFADDALLTAELARALLSDLGIGILPQFAEAGDVVGGLAAVSTDKGWGLLRMDATYAVTPRFPRIGATTPSGAIVGIAGLWSAIRHDGSRIGGAKFDSIGGCASDVCLYTDGTATGLFNLATETRQPIGFNTVGGLSDAGVALKTDAGWWIYSLQGAPQAGPFDAVSMQAPRDGTVIAETAPGTWALLDATTLQPRTPVLFEELRMAGTGLVAARLGGLWGFIEVRQGRFLVEPAFADVGAFSLGLAPATIDGKIWGYIDKRGVWAILPHYAEAGTFRQGLARVRPPREGVGFINTQGQITVPPVFDDARNFAEGHAAVRVGDVWGYIAKDQLP